MIKELFARFQKAQREGNHMKSMEVETSTKQVCLNCGTEYVGSFCPHCKQKADTHRLNIIDTIKGFFARFIRIDHGLIHTLIDLLYRPGYMVRDYFRGYRAEYVDPLLLLIILVAFDYMFFGGGETLQKPYPEELTKLLATYPISLKVTHISWWISSDIQRITLYVSLLLAPSICITLWLIRVKENRLNLSEAFHLLIYAFCIEKFIALVIELITIILGSHAPHILSNDMYILMGYILFLIFIMVRDCCYLGWKKCIAFILLEPIVGIVTIFVFYSFLILPIHLELPEELVHQVFALLRH